MQSNNIHRLAFSLWALLLLTALTYLGVRVYQGLGFDTSIIRLLPQGQQSPLAEQASQTMADKYSNRLLIMLGAEKTEAVKLQQQQQSFVNKLEKTQQFSLADKPFSTQAIKQNQNFYLPYRYHLLTATQRQQLEAGQGQTKQLLQTSLRQLFSPIPAPRTASILQDPANLLQAWLENKLPSNSYQLDQYGLFVEHHDRIYRIVLLEYKGAAFDLQLQQKLMQLIDHAEAELVDQRIEVLHSGLLFHAAAAAKQARTEISTIGLGSLLGICLLLIVSFRSAKPLILSLIALASGILIALAISLSVFGRLHLITLAFGASLIGVSIDYSLHYFCSYNKHKKNHLTSILPALGLGLASSVLAYATQSLTPFPGLQQMAVFSASGLIASCLTVVCLFPCFKLNNHHTSSSSFERFSRLKISHKLKTGILFSIIIFCGFAYTKLIFVDDLRLLNGSPQELLRQEEKIRLISQGPSVSQFLLVSGDSWQEVLEQQEQLAPQLNALISQGKLQSYQALSKYLPSRQRQEDNYQLLSQSLYQQKNLAGFFQGLGAPPSTIEQSLSLFFNAQHQYLDWDKWRASEQNELLSHLWFEASDSRKAGLIIVSGLDNAQVLSQLQNKNILLVDRVAAISNLLKNYRQQVGLWLALAYLFIFIVLLLRYKRSALRIIAAPLLATSLSFAVLSLAGIPLNLFSLLAALIVLGVALDMGIILQESQYQAHAWQAISLSALTTILAFGLLSLSQTPVLFYFGITLLPGIGFAWLLALLMAPRHKI